MLRPVFLLLFVFALAFACNRFDKHIHAFCTFAGEIQPCVHPNAQSFAAACCSAPGKCNSIEFPIKKVCCFTQECLDRCYPGKGHRVGQVY